MNLPHFQREINSIFSYNDHFYLYKPINSSENCYFIQELAFETNCYLITMMIGGVAKFFRRDDSNEII